MSSSAYQKETIKISAKRKATEDISSNPNKIIREVLCENVSDAIESKDLYNIKKVMYNARRKLVPKLPKSCLEMHAAVRNMCPILTNELLRKFPNNCVFLPKEFGMVM